MTLSRDSISGTVGAFFLSQGHTRIQEVLPGYLGVCACVCVCVGAREGLIPCSSWLLLASLSKGQWSFKVHGFCPIPHARHQNLGLPEIPCTQDPMIPGISGSHLLLGLASFMEHSLGACARTPSLPFQAWGLFHPLPSPPPRPSASHPPTLLNTLHILSLLALIAH